MALQGRPSANTRRVGTLRVRPPLPKRKGEPAMKPEIRMLSLGLDAVEAAFWPKVRIGQPEQCWPWSGRPNQKGYGRFCFRGQVVLAHRVAYALTHGPTDLCTCHSCDNAICCNPAHLWSGTRGENNSDMWAKGRGVSNGHLPNSGQFTTSKMAGENHHAHKLSESGVRELRRLRAGGRLVSALARQFGISEGQVSKVALGRSWPHVR